jgi:hypothetical protein
VRVAWIREWHIGYENLPTVRRVSNDVQPKIAERPHVQCGEAVTAFAVFHTCFSLNVK